MCWSWCLDELLSPFLQVIGQSDLDLRQHGGNIEEVFLQSVDQRDGELAVHYILLSNNYQPSRGEQKTNNLDNLILYNVQALRKLQCTWISCELYIWLGEFPIPGQHISHLQSTHNTEEETKSVKIIHSIFNIDHFSFKWGIKKLRYAWEYIIHKSVYRISVITNNLNIHIPSSLYYLSRRF